MSGVSERLKWARERLAGFTSARQFALRHDIPVSTYAGYENNSRKLDLPTASRLSKLLRVDVGWLLTGSGTPRPTSELAPITKQVTMVPVYSWIHAGDVGSADMSADPEDLVPIASDSKTLRALRVRGTSMNRVVDDGGVIVVDYEQCHPYDKMLVIARIGDEVTFKRYRDTNGPIRLEPDSTDPHETIFPGEGFEILGRVVYSIRSH